MPAGIDDAALLSTNTSASPKPASSPRTIALLLHDRIDEFMKMFARLGPLLFGDRLYADLVAREPTGNVQLESSQRFTGGRRRQPSARPIGSCPRRTSIAHPTSSRSPDGSGADTCRSIGAAATRLSIVSPGRRPSSGASLGALGAVSRRLPSGRNQSSRPSARRSTRKPPSCTARWWRRQSLVSCVSDVPPPSAHGSRWCASQRRAVQPGN
jgi:hypothetical protein